MSKHGEDMQALDKMLPPDVLSYLEELHVKSATNRPASSILALIVRKARRKMGAAILAGVEKDTP